MLHCTAMRGFIRLTAGSAVLAFSTLTAAPAGAAPGAAVIAEYCSQTDLECTFAPLTFDKTHKLPIAFDFDTGFIPKGSNLQVRLYAELPAFTRVKMDGELETTWPDAMTLATPGGGAGLLQFEYGLALGAEAKIDLTVLGVGIKWQGDVPFVPKVDFKMQGQKEFTSWAFDPNGVETSGITPKVRLFDVNLLGLIGIPKQISKGGIALDVAGELGATYITERIHVDPVKSTDKSIESDTDTVTRAFAGGPFVEYDVWPEGRVDYTGTLHLIPAFFLEVLGKDFTMPIIDFPISLAIGSADFDFDPVRVHVPLPDLEPLPPSLDFGTVAVGEEKRLSVDLSNIGEAKAKAAAFVDASHKDQFTPYPGEVFVPSMLSQKVEIGFSPKQSGPVKTTLTFVTNDPDGRFHTNTLVANGATADPTTPDPTGPGGPPSAGDSGGCGCQTPGRVPASPNSALLLGFGFVFLASRKRARHSTH